jgi:NADH dehydrogenase FAD-containing subunit
MADSNLTLIVGGGFLGLFAALHLRHRSYPHPIVLIDPQSQFAFKPMLYDFLSGEMQTEQVFPSYEELLTGSDISFVQDTATQIDLHARCVQTASGKSYHYGNLVLGVGSSQGYFGTAGAAENAFAFHTQSDVDRLMQHLDECLQTASQTQDPIDRQRLLTFAVVGAGATGVEIASTLADYLPQRSAALGGNVDELRILLVNHGREILNDDVNSHLKQQVLTELQHHQRAVELVLGVSVKSVTADRLTYQAQASDPIQTLATATTIWSAGTTANPVLKTLSLPENRRDRQGLPLVTPTLQLADFPEVFAGGDCAIVEQKSLPALAQVAYQQGAGIADNLVALANGKSPQVVRVNLRGTLVKLGIGKGLANIFDRVQIGGVEGALIRHATYLEMLPTPLHNFKATAEWIQESIFNRFDRPTAPNPIDRAKTPAHRRPALLWIGGGLAIASVLIGAIMTAERSPQWRETPTSIHR